MQKFKVPVTGFLMVQAESPEHALEVAKAWARLVGVTRWAKVDRSLLPEVKWLTLATSEVRLDNAPDGFINCALIPDKANIEDDTQKFDNVVRRAIETEPDMEKHLP